jgi:hypothetical protein
MTKFLTRATKKPATAYHHVVDTEVLYSYLDCRPGESGPEMWDRVFRQTAERFDLEAVNDLMTAFEEFAEALDRAEEQDRDPAELGGGPLHLNLPADEIRAGLPLLAEFARLAQTVSYARRVGTAPIGHDEQQDE